MSSDSSSGERRPSRSYVLDERKKPSDAEAEERARVEAAAAAKRKEAGKKAAETRAKNLAAKNCKSSAPESTPSKFKGGKKRKSPGSQPELEGDTETEDHTEEPADKKNKSSDDETDEVVPPKKGRGRPKKDTTTETITKADTKANTKSNTKTPAAALAPVDIDYDRIIDGVSESLSAYVNGYIDAALASVNHDQLANHITATVDTAMQPYLAILDPLLEFMQTCAKLKSDDEVEANTNKTAVKSLVEQLGKKGKKEELTEKVDDPF